MDSPAFLWISEMELDNTIFADQSDFMESIDEELAAILRQDLETCLSPGNNNSSNDSSNSTLINIPSTDSINSLCMQESYQLLLQDNNNNNNNNITIDHEPPAKLQKPNNFSNFSSLPNHQLDNPSAPILLNFGTSISAENPKQTSNKQNSRPLNPDEEAAVTEVLKNTTGTTNVNAGEEPKIAQPVVKKASRVRPPSQTYDHIIAERKRREQLSQRFVALSSIVPGLKKMDKTSVLGDAIKYLKHLQERVKILEEQAKKQTMESVVLVKKSQIIADDDHGSSEDESGSSDEQPLPEIEARVCNNHILIRVQCEKQKSVFLNLLSKVEKLNMTVMNTHVIPFGNLALDITIIAEMEKEFCLTVKDVVKRLRAALKP